MRGKCSEWIKLCLVSRWIKVMQRGMMRILSGAHIDTAIMLVVKACVYKSVLDDKCQLFLQLVEEVQSLTLLAYPMPSGWN